MATIAQAAETVSFNAQAVASYTLTALAKKTAADKKSATTFFNAMHSMITANHVPALTNETYKATLGGLLGAKALEEKGYAKASAASYATAIKAMFLAMSHGFEFNAHNMPGDIKSVPSIVREFLASKGLVTLRANETRGRKPQTPNAAKGGIKPENPDADIASEGAADAFMAAAEVLLPDAGNDVRNALVTLCKADATRFTKELLRLVKSLG